MQRISSNEIKTGRGNAEEQKSNDIYFLGLLFACTTDSKSSPCRDEARADSNSDRKAVPRLEFKSHGHGVLFPSGVYRCGNVQDYCLCVCALGFFERLDAG